MPLLDTDNVKVEMGKDGKPTFVRHKFKKGKHHKHDNDSDDGMTVRESELEKQLDNERRANEAWRAAAQHDFQLIEGQLREVQGANSALRSEREGWKAECDTQRRENHNLKNTQRTLEDRIDELRTKLSHKDDTIAAAKDKLKKKEKDLTAEQKVNGDTRREILKSHETIRQLQETRKQHDVESRKSRAELHEQHKLIRMLQLEKDGLETDMTSAARKLAEKTGEATTAEKKLSALLQRLDIMREQNACLKDEVIDLKARERAWERVREDEMPDLRDVRGRYGRFGSPRGDNW